MLVHRFETAYLFSHPFSAVDEVIIQTARHRDMAVIALVDEVLGDPPWFVAKPAVEAFRPGLLFAARIDIDCKNILAEPGQKVRMNLRADILSRRILGGCLEFLFELSVSGRIKFEEETLGIFQRSLVGCG